MCESPSRCVINEPTQIRSKRRPNASLPSCLSEIMEWLREVSATKPHAGDVNIGDGEVGFWETAAVGSGPRAHGHRDITTAVNLLWVLSTASQASIDHLKG